ncbi:hypothetical protein HDU85_006395 [Gaertneriomyces sp. JEL0708]|nr:hypothetical protein HDU85_006395 [Gaertneriomyces sp. JEL0708]
MYRRDLSADELGEYLYHHRTRRRSTSSASTTRTDESASPTAGPVEQTTGPVEQTAEPAEQTPGPAEQTPGPEEQTPGPAEQITQTITVTAEETATTSTNLPAMTILQFPGEVPSEDPDPTGVVTRTVVAQRTVTATRPRSGILGPTPTTTSSEVIIPTNKPATDPFPFGIDGVASETDLPAPSQPPRNKSMTVLVGAVAGSIAFLLILFVGRWLLLKRRRKPPSKPDCKWNGVFRRRKVAPYTPSASNSTNTISSSSGDTSATLSPDPNIRPESSSDLAISETLLPPLSRLSSLTESTNATNEKRETMMSRWQDDGGKTHVVTKTEDHTHPKFSPPTDTVLLHSQPTSTHPPPPNTETNHHSVTIEIQPPSEEQPSSPASKHRRSHPTTPSTPTSIPLIRRFFPHHIMASFGARSSFGSRASTATTATEGSLSKYLE